MTSYPPDFHNSQQPQPDGYRAESQPVGYLPPQGPPMDSYPPPYSTGYPSGPQPANYPPVQGPISGYPPAGPQRFIYAAKAPDDRKIEIRRSLLKIALILDAALLIPITLLAIIILSPSFPLLKTAMFLTLLSEIISALSLHKAIKSADAKLDNFRFPH